MSGAPRVLVLLPQLPHDPASGAARTVVTIAEHLAAAGLPVRGLATTFSEGAAPVDAIALLAAGGIRARREDGPDGGPVVRYVHRDVEHVLLPGDRRTARFDALFDLLLASFGPDVLVTFGASEADLNRLRRARERGCRVVFALYNAAYRTAAFARYVDSVLTPSRFLTGLYWERFGLRSTPLPSPLHLDEVVAPDRSPASVTMVNPSIGKGAMLMATLVEQLATRHPNVPIEIIESRGTGRLLVLAGFAGGFDLRRHRSLRFRPPVALPRDVYGRSRVLLVPSVAEEASARVVAEALVNGIPIVVSERGGLPESCGRGGRVVPLPPTLTVATRRPVLADAVEPWLEAIVPLFRDEAAYRRASRCARREGRRFHPARVAAEYVEFVRAVAEKGEVG